VYVPAGRAPYPSTVVMGVTTALAAGVEEVAVCCPPTAGGDIDPVVLAACRLTGTHTVYRMGGAQAIGALAYGTELIAPVDVIVGPGNLYVQEAKRQVFGQVAIDGFAGPSDLLVLAGEGTDAELIAQDLLAQAEHGAATIVIAASTDASLLATIAGRLEDSGRSDAIARLVLLDSPEDALELTESFAPEHLELVGGEMEALAGEVTRAGCVLLGAAGATAFGDYIAGSNHVLPTGGAARFASALSPRHFRRSFSEVRIGPAAAALARAAAPLARAEGFEWHARSMEARIDENERA
jgi:histidinol dehydrogenase